MLDPNNVSVKASSQAVRLALTLPPRGAEAVTVLTQEESWETATLSTSRAFSHPVTW